MWQSYKLSILVIVLQASFLVLFGVFVKYPKLGLPSDDDGTTNKSLGNPIEHQHHGAQAKSEIAEYYPFFQDVHVMIFVGFGFLMTFLKRYGFSSVGLNMLVSALVIQWGTLTAGWILHFEHNEIRVKITDLIGAEFAAAAVLISFGAILGKVNALQLLTMALIEVVLFQANEYVVFHYLQASDIGDSMVVHVFGAYFGLAVARVLYNSDIMDAEEKESSVYHSDIFAMIGTIFLWMFWPSFNSATAAGEGQYRAVINTYFSLSACAVVAFAVSALIHKGKFNMVHIQNATLAGGVAVGTMADMIIEPWASILIGSLAAILSIIGYHFITPFLSHKFGIHDTCGVNNLHGMPGIMSGIGGIICAALAHTQLYGSTLETQFAGRAEMSASQQAGYQALALLSSFVIAVLGGILTGFFLRIPIWDQPKTGQVFDDSSYWVLSGEGFPTGISEQHEIPIHDIKNNV